MPAKNKRQISIWLTPEQHDALMTVTTKYERSEFIRDALKEAVTDAGGKWPDNMPEMGAGLNPPKTEG